VAKVQKLAGGFYNISGGAVNPTGDFYFVDAHWNRIHRLSTDGQLSTVLDTPIDPVNLAFDKAGNMLVVAYPGSGLVYAFKPGAPMDQFELLKRVDAAPRPGMTAVLPIGDYRIARDLATGVPVPRPYQYISPDGTTFISARQDFATGAVAWGIKGADVLRSFGLAPAAPGKPFYITSERELITWRGLLGPDGNFTEFKPFIQHGGEGVAVDAEGNIYLAAGQIYVYNPAGKLIDTIETPERPIQVVFGGKDGRTLFIAARTSLYSVRTRVRGR
jgi:sugar lactone lactonase YvrE